MSVQSVVTDPLNIKAAGHSVYRRVSTMLMVDDAEASHPRV